MTEEALQQYAGYVLLLVHAAGGEVRIPFDEAENIPADRRVKFSINHETEELVFTFEDTDAEQ